MSWKCCLNSCRSSQSMMEARMRRTRRLCWKCTNNLQKSGTRQKKTVNISFGHWIILLKCWPFQPLSNTDKRARAPLEVQQLIRRHKLHLRRQTFVFWLLFACDSREYLDDKRFLKSALTLRNLRVGALARVRWLRNLPWCCFPFDLAYIQHDKH